MLEREAVTDHDVAAFVDVVQDRIGSPEGSWIHYGLTSTDVVDTALCWAMRDAATELIAASTELLRTLVDLARAHRDTVMIGRTHGIHAEPTTFGAKVALWALQVDRDRSRLTSALAAVSVMKLSGAVGTYSNIPPEVEAYVGRAPRPDARPRDPGGRAGPPRRVPLGLRRGRNDVRGGGGRTPAPAAHRGERGAGGLQARPEGVVGDAAQAQPDLGRNDLRACHGC